MTSGGQSPESPDHPEEVRVNPAESCRFCPASFVGDTDDCPSVSPYRQVSRLSRIMYSVAMRKIFCVLKAYFGGEGSDAEMPDAVRPCGTKDLPGGLL